MTAVTDKTPCIISTDFKNPNCIQIMIKDEKSENIHKDK